MLQISDLGCAPNFGEAYQHLGEVENTNVLGRSKSCTFKTGNCVRKGPISSDMLKWTLICAVLAIIFGVLGFTGIAAGFAFVAKVLFAVFLFGVLLTLILGVTVFREVTR